MEIEDEGQSSSNKSTGNADNPKGNFARDSPQDGSVEDNTKEESTPATDNSCSETLALVEEETTEETNQDRASKDDPGNPSFCGITEEGGVEEKPDERNRHDCSDEEQGH